MKIGGMFQDTSAPISFMGQTSDTFDQIHTQNMMDLSSLDFVCPNILIFIINIKPNLLLPPGISWWVRLQKSYLIIHLQKYLLNQLFHVKSLVLKFIFTSFSTLF